MADPAAAAASSGGGSDLSSGGKSTPSLGGGDPFGTMGGSTDFSGGMMTDPFFGGMNISGGTIDPSSSQMAFADPSGTVGAQTALTGGTQQLPQSDVGEPGGTQSEAPPTTAEQVADAAKGDRAGVQGAGDIPESLRSRGLQQLKEGAQAWQLGGQPTVPGPTGPTPAAQPQGAGDIPENLRQQGLEKLATQMKSQGGQTPPWLQNANVQAPPQTQFAPSGAQTAGPAVPTQPGAPQQAPGAPQQTGDGSTPQQQPQMPRTGGGGGDGGGQGPGGGGGRGDGGALGALKQVPGILGQLNQLAQQVMGPPRPQMPQPSPMTQYRSSFGPGMGGRFGPGPPGGIARGGVGGVAPFGPRGDRMRDGSFPPGTTGGRNIPPGTPQPGSPGTARANTPPPGAPPSPALGTAPPPSPPGAPPGGITHAPMQTASGQPIAPLTGNQVGIPRWSNAARNMPTMRPTQPSVDRRAFMDQIKNNPQLIARMAHMVNGEVGKNAPLHAKIVQLETLFNRSQMRGHGLQHGLMTVRNNGGYYANGTYSRAATPSPQEISQFAQNVLMPVLNGSNQSDIGYGPMTGNASAGVARRQFERGQMGYKLNGGDTYFREGPFNTLPSMPSDGAGAQTPPPAAPGINPAPTPSGNPLQAPGQRVPGGQPVVPASPQFNRAGDELRQLAMDTTGRSTPTPAPTPPPPPMGDIGTGAGALPQPEMFNTIERILRQRKRDQGISSADDEDERAVA